MKKKFITKLTKLAMILAMVATLTACGEDEVVVAPEPVVAEDPVVEEPAVEEPIEEVANQEEASTEDFIFQENEDGSGVILTGYEGTASMVTVPDTYDGKPVVAIGGGCFYANEVIEEVILPDSVISINNEAFCMSSLKNITLGNATEIIGNDAFDMCSSLEAIILPDTITVIGEGAFATTGIKEIIIPSQIEILPMNVFALSNLEKIIIPGSVKEIGENAFDGCSQLKEVEIQEGVESIGDGAFNIETEITVSIPASVTFIDPVEFTEENTNLILVAGSYAEGFAKDWELNYTTK